MASDLACDPTVVHPDVRDIKDGSDAIQVITPWSY